MGTSLLNNRDKEYQKMVPEKNLYFDKLIIFYETTGRKILFQNANKGGKNCN